MAKKSVIVTGGAGMLGNTLIEKLHEDNWETICIDLNDYSFEGKQNNSVRHVSLDVCDEKAVENFFLSIEFEKAQIFSLINCAGISTFRHYLERSKTDFLKVVDVNLFGTFNFIKNYVKFRKSNKSLKGSIVNTGSIFGVNSSDYRNYVDLDRMSPEVYGATKAGVVQMTKYFAAHLATEGIRVNCVSPGGILNEDQPQGQEFQKLYNYKVPLGRMARNEEIVGGYIYFLNEEAASYTTGQNLFIDGGYTAW